MGRVAVPISDYVGDTKGALDNSVRILQAIVDLAADAGWLTTTLATMHLVHGLMQVCQIQIFSYFDLTNEPKSRKSVLFSIVKNKFLVFDSKRSQGSG